MNYDQKEGISSRTGNRPLSTVDRVQADPVLFDSVLTEKNMTVSELADHCALPAAFLEAIKSGEWSEISKASADTISRALETDLDQIFQPIEKSNPVLEKSDDVQPTQVDNKRADSKLIPVVVATTLIVLILCISWFTSDRDTGNEPFDTALITNTVWHASFFLENDSLPVDETTRNLFSDGGYLKLATDGHILFNWIDPTNLMTIPFLANWELVDQQIVINLGGTIYSLNTESGDGSLAGYDAMKAFKLVMTPISLEE